METHRRRQRFSFTLDHQPGPVFPSFFRYLDSRGGRGVYLWLFCEDIIHFIFTIMHASEVLVPQIFEIVWIPWMTKNFLCRVEYWIWHFDSGRCHWKIKDNNYFCVCIFRKSIQIPCWCHQQWSCDCLRSRPLSRNRQRTGRIHHSNQRCWCR